MTPSPYHRVTLPTGRQAFLPIFVFEVCDCKTWPHVLLRNVRKKIFTLGDDVVVYPGHGPKTTVGRERKTNPFLTT